MTDAELHPDPANDPPAPGAHEKLDRLRTLLREMFQLDRGDLDFGLYRIMNLKSAEIAKFLDEDLLPQVKSSLRLTSAEDRAALEEELKSARTQAFKLGYNPDTQPSDVITDLNRRLDEMRKDAAVEADVYNHLANFFARYYSEGDFISQRRYSAGGRSSYLIPYDGEEVKLHWANADQYYIKTTENYASYAFTVDAGEATRRVRFEIAAADNERDNIKAPDGKQRRFVLASADAVGVEGGELVVRFEHRPLTQGEKKAWPGNGGSQQRRINEVTTGRILSAADPDWQALLSASAPTEANGERTLLAKHVERYTAKNTFDYFIHKDLGGFLRQELDLYLNTEVLNLDDIEQGDAVRLDRALARLRAIRRVGGKVIDFLAQLEDFQKQLWLKKKFVLETNWCVTLDRVPEEMYPEIAANPAQCQEWVELFAVDEIHGDLANGNTSWSNPPSPDFLKANPYLVLDTKHFPRHFTDRLLAALSDAGPLDEQMDGLLIHGENFQALNLLQARYQGQVQCVYIDPPYNTGSGDFMYKDGYRSSSWMSALTDRITLSRQLLSQKGQLVTHIDEHEGENLKVVISDIFGTDNYLGEMIWNKRNPKGDAKGLAVQHESILWVIRNADSLSSNGDDLLRPKKNAKRMLEKAQRCIKGSGNIEDANKSFASWLQNQSFSGGELAYNRIDDKGRVFQTVSMAWPNKSPAPPQYFEPLIHPVTGKPCPVPKRGWRNIPKKMASLLANDLIVFGEDESTQPRRKYLLEENLYENIPSVFDFGGSSDIEAESLGVFFETMKPLTIAKYICNLGKNGLILDYFAGSGTTGHAVIELNRENNIDYNYILVEIDNCFDTVLLPRMKKIVYSSDWKNGKPVSRKGSTQLFKYLHLECYEDALDSLQLTAKSKAQRDLLAENSDLAEDYQLHYSLGSEVADSACLLGKEFKDPFAYALPIIHGGVRCESEVDLPETFNYLIGLSLESRQWLDGVLTITGKNAEGRTCLILWRNRDEMDYAALDAWFVKNRTRWPEHLDLVYVNGDHTLNAVCQPTETWVAETIEPIFRELMFGATE